MHTQNVFLSVVAAAAVAVTALSEDAATVKDRLSLTFASESLTGLVSLPFQTGSGDSGPSTDDEFTFIHTHRSEPGDGQPTRPVESSTFIEDGPSSSSSAIGIPVTKTDSEGSAYTTSTVLPITPSSTSSAASTAPSTGDASSLTVTATTTAATSDSSATDTASTGGSGTSSNDADDVSTSNTSNPAAVATALAGNAVAGVAFVVAMVMGA